MKFNNKKGGGGGGAGKASPYKKNNNGKFGNKLSGGGVSKSGGRSSFSGGKGGGSPGKWGGKKSGGFKENQRRSGGGGGFKKTGGGVQKDNPNFTKLGKNKKLASGGDDDDEMTADDIKYAIGGKGVKKEFEEGGDGDEDLEVEGVGGGGKKGGKGMKKKTGGFQSMGLSPLVLKGVLRRGYQVPTPVQRKTIPVILEGKDVVAMARTGSGKTAAFLIPLFERLHVNRTEIGTQMKFPRALILSPTRELATQTVKFFKELGRFVTLKVATILGGESMDAQFQAMHDKPDVVIATPGRFMHLCVEMEMKLDGVEYVVFDEADRLFEMGFGEQVNEIVRRLPNTRQTVLFSATLPKLLVEFTKAGLHDPSLIRLDVDTKLPDTLQLTYLACRSEDKMGALMHLLKNLVDAKGQTLVFAATKHHVELVHQLLDEQNISNCYIYSSLDPAARKISIAKFRGGKCNVMIVTDIAARGIDIPVLDNVINFHFPAKPKLFMHRVGRVARAGRSGTAYSIIAPDEVAFLLDLHLFLNKPLKFTKQVGTSEESIPVGRVPQDFLSEENSIIANLFTIKAELDTQNKVCKNGYRQYLKSRPNASTESNRRAKDIELGRLPVHPLFEGHIEEDPMDSWIFQIQGYRPNSTVFEIGPKAGSETQAMMKVKRQLDQQKVEKYRMIKKSTKLDDAEIKTTKKDEENFIPYLPKDHATETGLSVGTTFDKEIQESVMDITGDDSDMLKNQRSVMKWDQRKKNFVTTGRDGGKAKKIRTESGAWIAASYKSDRYQAWKDRSKIEQQSGNNSDDEDADDFTAKGSNPAYRGSAFSKRLVKTGKNEGPGAPVKKGQRFNTELKRPEQILKDRKVKEKKRLKNTPGKKKKGKGGPGGKPGNKRRAGKN